MNIDSCLEQLPRPFELRELQLRVARRADQLARRFLTSRGADRTLWLRAELEIFELVESPRDQPSPADAGEEAGRSG